MKILLFCPLNPERDHKGTPTVQLFGRTNQSIFRQDYPKLDIFFSKGDNPYFDSNGRNNIAHNYNKAREWVLANDYDALFTVEADMVIPPDALSKLLSRDGDVVYGLYCFKRSSVWSAFTELSMKSGRSLSKDKERARSIFGDVIDVAGVGHGCTLIHRRVLEQVPFRTNEAYPGLHNDWVFAYDLQEAGFRQVCDTSVVCGHIDLKPTPRVIWPDPSEPRLYRNDFIDKIPVNERGEVEIEITSFGEITIKPEDLALPLPEAKK